MADEHPAPRHRCAIVGTPVGHSRSPVLHRAGYAALGLIGWEYSRIECDEAGLPVLLTTLGTDWAGLSVTMPAKAAAAAAADRSSDRVQLLGVANTLVHNGSGWDADNTDVDGVRGALNAGGLSEPGTVLLLGGGGTALSALLAVAEMGAQRVIVAGRRPQSRAAALALAAEVGIPAVGCAVTEQDLAAAMAGVDLVLSAVPAGAADAYASILAPAPVLLDVVYHPWPTPLAAARGADRVTLTGLDMLLHQALRQFELHTGRPAPATAMRAALRESVGAGAPELPVDNCQHLAES